MIKEVSVTVNPEKENDKKFILSEICSTLNKEGFSFSSSQLSISLLKKSIDARHKKIRLVLRYKVSTDEEKKEFISFVPKWKKVNEKKKVIIIGCGPAGLFGSLRLLEKGIKPVIVERGKETTKRKIDIDEISTKGILKPDSNYCYGAGGAGTFSDGKLYTRSTKRGNVFEILQMLNYFGAKSNILTDSHPHIGTDCLPNIIDNILSLICKMGGEVLFNTKCESLLLKEEEGKKKVLGITAQKEDTFFSLEADAVLLATGHSASDIYRMISKCAPEALDAKTFAMGVRIEHPRKVIDEMQYHGKLPKGFGAAEYRISSQVEGRGVYSFCMCPGGFIVPASTGKDEIVVNGMSSSNRNSRWSNSAIVVEIRPEDIPDYFKEIAIKNGSTSLSGLEFRSFIEKETFLHGSGQKAPAQRLTDFLEGRESKTLPDTSYAPGVVPSRLDKWIPDYISKRLKKAFSEFRKMKGFVSDSALLIASETRTSTPVRILRNKETFECVCIKNLFPAGEGSGYSGGIISSAIDGENACEQIAKKCNI